MRYAWQRSLLSKQDRTKKDNGPNPCPTHQSLRSPVIKKLNIYETYLTSLLLTTASISELTWRNTVLFFLNFLRKKKHIIFTKLHLSIHGQQWPTRSSSSTGLPKICKAWMQLTSIRKHLDAEALNGTEKMCWFENKRWISWPLRTNGPVSQVNNKHVD